jgi:hypothetical protein
LVHALPPQAPIPARVTALIAFILDSRDGVHLGQRRFAIQRLDSHSRSYARHTRLHWETVGHHQTLRALSIGAKDALWRAILVVVAKDAHTACKQGRGDRLAFACVHHPALPEELKS